MHNRADSKQFQKTIRHKIRLIFNIYEKLGISEIYGKNSVKIDRNKLKNFSLNDILSYAIKNPEN